MARYIDADKLHEHITTNHCGECGIYNGEMCCSCPMDKALNYIEDFPIADVAPRADVFADFESVLFSLMYLDYDGKYHLRKMNADRVTKIFERYYKIKEKYTEAEPPKGD